MIVNIRSNLFDLIKRLEQQKGHSVTHTYIAERSGLSRYTIQKVAKDNTGRIDFDTMQKLLNFFEAEGLPITIDDLFTTERVADRSHERQPA